MGDLKRKIRAFREKELLSMAERMLATDGCQSFSNGELAKRTGIGKGTIYSHYSSQRSLIDAVLSRVSERLLLQFQIEPTGDPRSQLVRVVSQIIDELVASPTESLRYPCCLRLSPCPHYGFGKIEQILLALIERGAQAGTVRLDIDSGLAARFLHHLLTAAATHHSSRDELHSNLRAVCQFYLDGIMAC